MQKRFYATEQAPWQVKDRAEKRTLERFETRILARKRAQELNEIVRDKALEREATITAQLPLPNTDPS